jgi:hypothetical protein
MVRMAPLLFLSVLFGCSENIQYAAGKEDEIFVVIDPTTWNDVEEPLRMALERKVPIVHPEQIFSLVKTDPGQFPRFRARKNLLIIGRIRGQRSSALIQELLPPSSLEGGAEEGSRIFFVENRYREGQLAIVIVGASNESLRETVRISSDALFQTFWDGAKKRIKKRALVNLNSSLINRFAEDYGWSLKLPVQYKLTRKEERLVRLARHYPDRLISVHWEERKGIEPDECLERREWFGRVFLDGDTILRDMTKAVDVEVNGVRGTRIDGVWQNEEHVMGGAFITLCIYDPNRQRDYLIDGLLFAPGRKKWIYLAELEGIVESFTSE